MPNLVRPSSNLQNALFLVFFVLCVMLSLTSCVKKQGYDADISKIKIEPILIKRYEKVLFEADPNNLKSALEPYYDEFYPFLGEEVKTPAGQQQLYNYVTDPFIREVYDDVKVKWNDVSKLEQQLTLAFRYFKYHFPDRSIPEIYSYVSGINFELPVYYQDDIVVIGLDMYMGGDYVNYDRQRIPAFKRVRFTPEAAPVELMREIGLQIFSEAPARPETLLDVIIMQGKIIYFLDAMFPSYPDSLKIYFSSDQIQWAKANESQAWTFILNNEMVYSTDRQLIQKLTGDAPFTAPFSGNSAPRMGVYNGWQIVREYMRRNPEVTMEMLFFEKTDSREILSQSRYRP
jgi:hypothetical protein